jgi:hypothetical protein
MILKVLANRGLGGYFSDRLNIFDFVVVMSSMPSLIQPIRSGSLEGSKISSVSSVRIVRLFRVFRVARLLHKLESMRKLLATVLHSMTAIAHLSLFILFVLVSSAILATNLFSRPYAPTHAAMSEVNSNGYNIYAGGELPRYHFDTFLNSMLSLFIIMTGTTLQAHSCSLRVSLYLLVSARGSVRGARDCDFLTHALGAH